MKDLPKIQGQYLFNVPLTKYNWFGTNGKADILFIPKNKEDLIFFLKNKSTKLPIFVLGAGSNLLIRDGGIRGVTILLRKNLTKIFINNDGNIESDCGIFNSKFFSFCKKNKIGGYEFLGTIPGTIGGAIRMNAGCYGSEIKDKLISVNAVDLDGNEIIYTNKECNFEYRNNKLPKNLVFISAIFKTDKKESERIIEANFKEMLKKRKLSQPTNVKTCGCTFKNLENYPAWKLIKEAGCQGLEINGAEMSDKHANFMINSGNASASDLENLGEKVRECVKKHSGITLEWEICRVGEK
jgi:UDP-N-acetylmuramate dehydrogenase